MYGTDNSEKSALLNSFKRSNDILTFQMYKTTRNKLNKILKKNYREFNKTHFDKLDKPKDKWNFINNIRQSGRTIRQIECMRNSFGQLITEPKKIANFLNYKFSVLLANILASRKTHRYSQTPRGQRKISASDSLQRMKLENKYLNSTLKNQ